LVGGDDGQCGRHQHQLGAACLARAHGLEPNRVRQFKRSYDKGFADKVRKIVGLDVDPVPHAVVLSVDEKSRIQVLDGAQPGSPIKKGRRGTTTLDGIRNGTTTLFAALNVIESKLIDRCMQRHHHPEFIRFLNTGKAEVHAGKIGHVFVYNYATHKHPKVKAWLARHPRFASTSPRPPARGSTPSGPSPPSSRDDDSSVASPDPSSSSRPPSTASSPRPTMISSPSSGQPTPTKSSPRSIQGTKR
jgi:hypothetical protein